MRFYDSPSRLIIFQQLLADEPTPTRHTRLRHIAAWLTAIIALGLAHGLWVHATAQSPKLPAITTVAGNGTSGYVPAQDGGLATRAQLGQPYATAIDPAGNLYIADQANHRIRKVDAATGIITTVAGTGNGGFRKEDDDGLATAAELNGPRGITVDRAGNLYIADTDNHRIRRVTPSGIITTIAGVGVPGYRSSDEGAPAISARLDSPRGVAVDSVGDLYIADYNNSRIRKVAMDSGTITTVAGTGMAGYAVSEDGGLAIRAELNDPYGVTVDLQGNLYIADTDNQRVRKVDAATGRITTVAGNGLAVYSSAQEGQPARLSSLDGPCSVAVDAAGNLFIADLNDSRVLKVDARTGRLATLAGNGIAGYMLSQEGAPANTARLNKPRGLSVDRFGNLYIADFNNNRIRKVETGSQGVVLAGN